MLLNVLIILMISTIADPNIALAQRLYRTCGKQMVEYKALPTADAFHRSQARFRWMLGGNRSGKAESNIGYDLSSFALGVHPFRETPEDAVIWAITDTWEMAGKLLWGEKLKAYLPKRAIKRIVWHNKNADIPKEIEFKGKQLRQVESIRSGKTLVDLKAITEHLAKAAWPLHFLDFETVAPAVPPYDGTRPFQNLTFQASIHVQEKPGGDLKHHELLVDPDKDPRRPMLDFLLANIDPEDGSVVAYNAPFERGCIFDLGEAFPDDKESMKWIIDRLWDVAVPFQKAWYMHPAFHGSWSLKSVLPVLIPTMSYAELDIAQGGDASAVYAAAMNGTLVGEKKDKAFKALLEYCTQDTFATVKIFDHLQETVSTQTEHANKAAKEKMAT